MDVCHIGQTTSHRDAGMRMPMGTPPSPQQPTQTSSHVPWTNRYTVSTDLNVTTEAFYSFFFGPVLASTVFPFSQTATDTLTAGHEASF